MKIDRNISLGQVVQIVVIIVAVTSAYFALKYQVAGASEMAERAEKLSATNTEQISELKGIVNQLTTAVTVQNETILRSGEITKIQTENLKERLNDLKTRIESTR